MVYATILLLRLHTMCIYFLHDLSCKNPYMLDSHVFARFAHAQVYISDFAGKLICRCCTIIVKENSQINFQFLHYSQNVTPL